VWSRLRRRGGVRCYHCGGGARHQCGGSRGGGHTVEGGRGGGHAVEGGRGGGAGINECGEMIGLEFGGLSALKKKNSSDGR
jgi:hypothetical protein